MLLDAGLKHLENITCRTGAASFPEPKIPCRWMQHWNIWKIFHAVRCSAGIFGKNNLLQRAASFIESNIPCCWINTWNIWKK
jgi:hypothetical protein